MDRQTSRALCAINRDFYRRHAAQFSRSRQAPWNGWNRVLRRMQEHGAGAAPWSLLDVGCGNGRLARFCAHHAGRPFTYVGVDSSPELLQLAHAALSELPNVTLLELDVVSDDREVILPRRFRRRFTLVAAFGLLHHIPGRARREALLRELAACVAPGGLLALSLWQFARFERFRRKLVACDAELVERGGHIDQLEAGDHLLPWGPTAGTLRYCHFVDTDEAAQLLCALPELQRVDSFDADGKNGRLNHYVLLKRGDPTAE